VLDAAGAQWQDRRMIELPALLEPGDLLLFNDTRVLPARVQVRKASGGRLEMLLERPLADQRALVQLRDSKSVRVGMTLLSAGGPVTVVQRRAEFWEIELPLPAVSFFERHGSVPLPPYIEREADESDRERYQSVFARVPGAVASPTASLHFDTALIAALAARGILQACVTLHVAAGTFQPLRSESLAGQRLHREWYQVGAEAAAAIARARAERRRVIAVGTTVARALESAALAAEDGGEVAVRPLLRVGASDTTLFIHPGYRFRIIDGLITNFHLPQSTLLMLVCAFAGRELVLAAYAHAVAARYRFFSYGDAMLVWPLQPRGAFA
jgi:S-adenosylmethionine:tRNA ribosyltransferase-isomerase